MQGVQFIIWFVTALATLAMIPYAFFIGCWFMGWPPFHRAFRDDSQPVAVMQVPVARCPRCGFTSKDFQAFVDRLKLEEHGEEH